MIVGAFAIIRDDLGRFLISHRRDQDLWNLPGGGVEPGEAPWDAVIREVMEETGLQVETTRLQGIYSKPLKDTIVFSFECRVIGGALALTDEADQHAYCHLREIPDNFSARQRERLRDAIDRPTEIVLKTQE